MKTILPGSIAKIITMADGSLKLHCDTQELTPEQMTEVFQLYNKFGYFYFSENAEKPEFDDLPPIKLEKDEKSKSMRLRATLYRLWEQTSNNKCTSEEFYNQKMEELIEHFKSKLI